MSLLPDMLASWVRPRLVLRRHLEAGPREDRALAFLMLGCLLVFASSVPALAAQAAAAPEVPLAARLGGAMLAWLALMPLALYAVAALSHLAARALGGRGSFSGARLALFWALLAAAPLWLAQAALQVAVPGPLAQAAAALALALALWIWLAGLAEVEWGGGNARV